jgi:serine/threonine-protein kinase HipA
MSVNGKFKDFTEEDLLAVADRFAIGTAATVIAQVRSATKAWRSYADKAGVSPGQIQHIEALLLPLRL